MKRSKKNSTEGRLIITKAITVLMLAASALFQTDCTKTDLVEAKIGPVETKSDAERIGEIDLQLANMVSSGRADDADKRSDLISERAKLRASAGFRVQTAQVQPKYSQPAVPPATATANTIVIAHDSARGQKVEPMDSETRRQLGITASGGHYDSQTRRIEPNRSW